MDHLSFLRDRIGGSNWVLARRSRHIEARYGKDVICVSKQRYAQIEKEYRVLYGDPYDKPRAAMYMALLAAQDELSAIADYHACVSDTVLDQIQAAIEAEQNAR